MYENMMSFLMDNLRGVIFAAGGLAAVFIILSWTAGLKYGKKWSAAVYFLTLVPFRIFFMQMFVQTYLGSLYKGRDWYAVLLLTTDLTVILIGILVIRVLFRGSLRKNLFTELLIEIGFVFLIDLPLHFLFIRFLGHEEKTITEFEVYDLIIPFWMSIILLIIFIWGKPVLRRYRNWEVRYPLLLDFCLVIYFGLSVISNIAMVMNGGYRNYLIYTAAMAAVFSYLWYDHFHLGRMKELARNAELAGQEKALKIRYEQTLIQTARINQYNTEIREAISRLLKKTGQIREDTASGNSTLPVSSGESSFNARKAGYQYLENLRKHYDDLSVSRYCTDPVLDQFLGQAELELKACGVEPVFMFHDYHTPTGINQQDVNEYLSWMISGIQKNIGGGRFFLRGGIRGGNLILSCEAEGGYYMAPPEKDIRKLRRRTKADVNVRVNKIVVGIPL